MVRFASLFDAKERTVTFLSGKKYSVDDLHSMGAGDLLNSMFEFSEKLNALRLSGEEMSLFTAVVLVSAGKGAAGHCAAPGVRWPSGERVACGQLLASCVEGRGPPERC